MSIQKRQLNTNILLISMADYSPFEDYSKMLSFITNLTNYLNKHHTLGQGKTEDFFQINSFYFEEQMFDLSKKLNILQLGEVLHDFYLKILSYIVRETETRKTV